MVKFVVSMALLLMSFSSIGAEFVEGQDYELLQGVGTSTSHVKKGVHVTEFFSYGCPWCYRLEASLVQWVAKQGSAISFSKVPVVFNANWEYYARAYYIIHSLSLSQAVSDALFKAIIIDKQSLNNTQAMVEFFKKQGVDASIVESAFTHSASISIKLKADALLMANDQINAIPAIVVNGKYKTNLQMAKTTERLFEILDYLIHVS